MAILDYISQDTIDRVNAHRTTCRCCGKNLGLERFMDDFAHPFARFQPPAPIHTRCIPKHCAKHAHGINATRCKEFGK